MSVGRSVRLFLVDGSPGGLLTAEVMNWTGHVVAAPRSDLGELLRRPEAGRTGVYLLLGEDGETGSSLAYVGEGDDIGKRVRAHAQPESKGGKDFWDRAILVTSKDTNLTKAHARYLESRLLALAGAAGRAKLQNATAPDPVSLPEADVSDMEYFISQVKLVLPVLGVNLLRAPEPVVNSPASERPDESITSVVFEFAVPRHGVKARAQEVDGEFTLLEGSVVRGAWHGAAGHSYSQRHAQLVADGVLAVDPVGKLATLTRNYVAGSPSAAAAIAAGRSANGRTSWTVVGDGRTYEEWQNAKLEAVEASDGGNR